MRREKLLAVLLLAPLFAAAVVSTIGQEESRGRDAEANVRPAGDQWEYLVVSGSSNVNFTSTNVSGMRKDASGAFGREAFVLEQHLDKLGAKGWELVAVAGPPPDPVYHFKRRK